MTTTETTPTVHQAMLGVMRQVRAVGKDSHNGHGNFNFRGIDATLNAIGPAMRDHGILPLPQVMEQSAEMVEVGNNRTRTRMVTVTVRYTFAGPAGDTVVVETPGEAMDSGDKAITKAMSVAYRTALLQTFALPTQEKDPDADSYERSPAEPATSQPPAEPTDAEVAMAQLTRAMATYELDAGTVVSDYKAIYGVDPRNDQNADNLREYVKGLEWSASQPAEPAQDQAPAEAQPGQGQPAEGQPAPDEAQQQVAA